MIGLRLWSGHAVAGAALFVAFVFAIVPAHAPSASGSDGGSGLTPIVLFPAFHFTKLAVTVHNQRVDPACPRSGTFEDWFLVDRYWAGEPRVLDDSNNRTTGQHRPAT